MADDDDYYRKRTQGGYGRDPRDFRRDYDFRGSGYNKRPYNQSNYDRVVPPMAKRAREWGDDTFDPQLPEKKEDDDLKKLTNPVLMSFKQFLTTQDDSITDEEAIKKYNDYKDEHRRQELHAFFIAHKEEEWFAEKYHPDLSEEIKKSYRENVQRRLHIFEWLSEKGYVDRARLEASNTTNILKLLDALVVKLEGGSDEDVNDVIREYDDRSELAAEKRQEREKKEEMKRLLQVAEEEGNIKITSNDVQIDESKKSNDEDEGIAEDDDDEKEEKTKGNDENKRDGAESAEEGEADKDDDEDEAQQRSPSRKTPEPVGDQSTYRKSKKLHKTSSIFLRSVAPHIKKSEIEEICKRFPGFLRVGLAPPNPERGYSRRGWITFRRDVNIKEITWKLSAVRIREADLGAIVNRDISNRLRNINGLSAHRTVAQNDLRLAAKLCTVFDKRADLYQSEELIEKRKKLPFEIPEGAQVDVGIRSGNPLLDNIEDLLVEEGSAYEDELLGRNVEAESEKMVLFERDEKILTVLDRILVYLRVVHSIDFYNHTDYPQEDDMPNRAGLVHVRSPKPFHKEAGYGRDEQTRELMVVQQKVTEQKNYQTESLQPLIDVENKVPDAEVIKLGKKVPEKEVEAFMTANSVELSKDKWLCPLSGKKFKGPEFIRKHIIGKHSDKLEEVSQEVKYFNNYLLDPQRPQPPVPTDEQLRRQKSSSAPSYMPRESYQSRDYYRPPPPSRIAHERPYERPPVPSSRGYGGQGRDSSRNYRDLDAPIDDVI